MGKYDHIITKNADPQFKILITRIAMANEKGEENRLKRIELAVIIRSLSKDEITLIETYLEEDLDLSDQA